MPTAAIAASAAAAHALGYHGLGDLIEVEQLSPQRILALFKLSISERASHDCAVVLFAGSIARYRAQPRGWDGHLEEQLAIEALASEPNPTAAFDRTSKEAAKLVAKHWVAIGSRVTAA
jgi:hypothetical protein